MAVMHYSGFTLQYLGFPRTPLVNTNMCEQYKLMISAIIISCWLHEINLLIGDLNKYFDRIGTVPRQKVHGQKVQRQKVHDKRFTTEGSRQKVHDKMFTT